MIGVPGVQWELVKPPVLPAHGHSPYETGHEKIFVVPAQRKSSSVPFRTARCFRGHYIIQKQWKGSYFNGSEEMAIRSEDMASIWGCNRL